MPKKAATKAEKKHLERVASLGCIACGVHGVQVHHIRDGQGMSQRASHFLTIPLCQQHHLGEFSIHGSESRAFKNIYGSDLDMLAKTIELLSEKYG